MNGRGGRTGFLVKRLKSVLKVLGSCRSSRGDTYSGLGLGSGDEGVNGKRSDGGGNEDFRSSRRWRRSFGNPLRRSIFEVTGRRPEGVRSLEWGKSRDSRYTSVKEKRSGKRVSRDTCRGSVFATQRVVSDPGCRPDSVPTTAGLLSFTDYKRLVNDVRPVSRSLRVYLSRTECHFCHPSFRLHSQLFRFRYILVTLRR